MQDFIYQGNCDVLLLCLVFHPTYVSRWETA